MDLKRKIVIGMGIALACMFAMALLALIGGAAALARAFGWLA